MSDDDSTESQPEAAPDAPAPDVPVAAAEPSATPAQSGVHIPTWLAGALVVVLAFVIGGVGFALGRSTADEGGRDFRGPALVRSAQENGGPGGNGFPGGQGGQRDGGPQFPGGQGGQGGREFPGGPGGPGGQQDGGPQNGGPQNGGTQDDGSTQGGA